MTAVAFDDDLCITTIERELTCGFIHLLTECCFSHLGLLCQHGDPNYSNKNHHWPEWRRRHVVRVKQLYSLEQQSDDDQKSSSSTTETCSSDTTASSNQDQSSDSAVDGFTNDGVDSSNHHHSTIKSKVMQSSYPGMCPNSHTHMTPYKVFVNNCVLTPVERVYMHVSSTCIHFTPFYSQSILRSSMNLKCN
jgi:hypothetical protein